LCQKALLLGRRGGVGCRCAGTAPLIPMLGEFRQVATKAINVPAQFINLDSVLLEIVFQHPSQPPSPNQSNNGYDWESQCKSYTK